MSWRSTRAAAYGGERNRQVAVIDLGSNSWRLVVFTYGVGGSPSWWKRTDELYEPVRISAGQTASGRLTDVAITRGLETLVVFHRFCVANDLQPGDVHAVATSAIREATNRDEFLAQAEAQSAIKIDVLSAEDEARFGYVAAVNTTTLTNGVVLEIGGGSMQLISVADRRAVELTSFTLGAVRMTEQFLSGDGPARKKDLQKLRGHVRDTLAELGWLPDSGPRLGGARRRGPQPRRRRAGGRRPDRPRDPGLRDHPRRAERARLAARRAAAG